MTISVNENKSNLKTKTFYVKNFKNSTELIEIVNEISKSIREYIKDLRPVDKNTQKRLLTYFIELNKKANNFNEDNKILDHLISEEIKYNAKLKKARAEMNDYDKRYFELVLRKIINPIIGDFKSRLLLKDPIPDIKSIEATEISLLEKDEKNIQFENLIIENQNSSVSTEEKNTNLPAEFQQIECKANKSQIIKYFMILSKTNNELFEMPYMKEVDVLELVKRNFKIFECEPTNVYFPINLTVNQKVRLRFFLHEFYDKYVYYLKDKKRYAYFLIHNFEIFRNDKLNSILSNMGLSKTKKPVEHHKIKVDWKTIN